MHRYNALDSPLLRVSRPVAACSRCEFRNQEFNMVLIFHRPRSKDQGMCSVGILEVCYLHSLV